MTSRARSDQGSVSLEFALVVPILLLLTLALVQVGLIVRDNLMLVSAARAGAREAAVTEDDDRVRQAVDDAAASALDADHIDMDVERSRRGDPASVSLTYEEELRVPFIAWLFPSRVTLRSAATMRQEFG
jgi:Flp pilus assembly protein TadG